jgi:hypothetical protein
VKEEHRDTREGKTREGIKNLLRISGVSDVGEQRGKNHQRNGGGCPSKHGSTLFALPALFLAGQKLPLSLGHLCHEALEKLPFLDPSLHLLTKLYRDIQGTGAFLLFPGQKSHFMKGTFLSTPTSRIAAPFFCNTQGGLNKGLYLSEPLQSYHSPLIGHQMTWHKYKDTYFPYNVNKKMLIAKKYFLFHGLHREKAGLKRVRIAKKIHSSLLEDRLLRWLVLKSCLTALIR